MQPLGSSRPPRHDPSPSRLAYRLNRLWLRPGFRRLVRLGGPVLILGLGGRCGLWLGRSAGGAGPAHGPNC